MSDFLESRRLLALTAMASYAATVPAANWLIGNVGTCIPNGPCVIPVGFGQSAPSGVLMIGCALVLRDIVQRAAGLGWSMACVVIGSLLSFALASPSIALASALSFAFSETLDAIVYSPLAKRGFIRAVVAGSIAGAVADSAIFLVLAFGSLDFITGQILGKVWAVLLFAIVTSAVRLRAVEA